MRKRTWKVVDWSTKPESSPVTAYLPFTCECGAEAECPVSGAGVVVEAIICGMECVTDPTTPKPKWFLPDIIQCRKCGREFETQGREESCVR